MRLREEEACKFGIRNSEFGIAGKLREGLGGSPQRETDDNEKTYNEIESCSYENV